MRIGVVETKNISAQDAASKILEYVRGEYHLVHILPPDSSVNLVSYYETLSLNLGQCFELGENTGSEKIEGKWTYVCYDPSVKDAYRSSANPQPLHTDNSYISESPNATLMYCLSSASKGGETVFISAEQLVAFLIGEAPRLLDQLFSIPVKFSRKFSNAENSKIRKIIDKNENGNYILTWNYYRVDPQSSEKTLKMCQEFHELLQEKVFGSEQLTALKLQPGEGVCWLDEKVLHGRNGFSAEKYGDRNLGKTSVKISL